MRKQLHSLLVASAVTLSFLQTAQAQNGQPYWSLAGNSNASASSKLGTTNNVNLRLFTNNSERMRINASNGWVGVGTTTPRGRFTLYNGTASVPAASWVTATSPMLVSYADATGGNGDFYLLQASNTVTTRSNIINRRARGTLAAPTAVANNDYIGSFQASGYDGSAFQNAANIDFFADGTPSSGNVPIRIAFSTGSNLGNRTQRMVIKSNGNVGIGTTSPSNKLHVIGRGRFSDGLSIEESGIYTVHTSGNGIEAYGNTSYGIGAYGSGNWGIYGSSTNNAYGVYGVSSSSYSANGSSGVYGTAYYGVQGSGTIGVYGTGTAYGVYAVGSGSGTYGSVSSGGYAGAYGAGDTYGVYGYSSTGTGVFGTSYGTGDGSTTGTVGWAGRFISNNYRGIYVQSATNWYAGYFVGDVYATGTFISSDARLKKDISDFGDAMSIINKLRPKHYEFRKDGNYAKLNLPQGLHYGLLAQDVEKVLPQLVRDANTNTRDMEPGKKLEITPGATPQSNKPVAGEDIEFKAVNYTELIPILVKAMQEQQAEIENLKNEVARLKQGQGGITNVNGTGMLSQATPNPVQGSTRINYALPQGASSGQLLLTDAAGKALKAIPLNASGTINLDTASLPSGTYTYSLMVGGKILEAKKLTVVR